MDFKPWPKITRLENKRPSYFTEKIDGTNACIVWAYEAPDENSVLTLDDGLTMWCQSRNKFIKPGQDNVGFALWASQNAHELVKLGEGHHFGEWWGLGIQRGYGLTEKKFSLFNTRRWGPHNPNTPACCGVVPAIHKNTVEEAKEFLIANGSIAAPGFMNVEGIVIYEPDTDTCFKAIIYK